MLRSINKVIKILVSSDFILNSGWGLLGPIFAIFVVQNIQGGDAKVAGISAAIYWIVKSLLQIPIGQYLDKRHGEKDDFYFMVFGTFLTGLVPFGFLLAFLPWHIYFLQLIHAFGMAMVVPPWSAIFTRHIDKGKEAFEWGIESTFLGLGAGIAGAIGGILVTLFGFKVIFILVGTFTLTSTILLLSVHKEIAPRDKLFPPFPPFRLPF